MEKHHLRYLALLLMYWLHHNYYLVFFSKHFFKLVLGLVFVTILVMVSFITSGILSPKNNSLN